METVKINVYLKNSINRILNNYNENKILKCDKIKKYNINLKHLLVIIVWTKEIKIFRSPMGNSGVEIYQWDKCLKRTYHKNLLILCLEICQHVFFLKICFIRLN